MITEDTYRQDDQEELKEVVENYIKKWDISDFMQVISDALENAETIFFD